MLILTRRISETMMIGDDVNITILGIKGNQVRLGINAPAAISVHREEIYLKIKKETEQGGFYIKPTLPNNNINKKLN